MDYSEEIENSFPDQRTSPNDKKDDDDLHIIGVKVKIGNSEAHTFPIENRAEISTPAEDSKRTFGRQVTESHHGVRKVKISCSSGDGKQESAAMGKASPILELQLGSLGKEDKGFELLIKSKPNDKDFPSEDESFCSSSEYYDAEDHLNNSDKTNIGREALQKTAIRVTPVNVTEMSSEQTQTEKELESSSAQTTMVQVTYPDNKQETTTQTDRKCDVSTSTENLAPSTESTETQTEKEFESYSAQTTRVQVSYPDSKQETATQTDRDASTSTENLAPSTESTETQTEKELESSSAQTARFQVSYSDNKQETTTQTDRDASTSTENLAQSTESTETQTEKELESSSAQTTMVQVTYPDNRQETTTQTDRKCDASTSTENLAPSTESTEIQTENVPKKHVSFQTDTERVTGASQTETAALFSIERTYEASTQTDEVAEASTSTDFDIYIVDRTKLSEKNTDTDDLPYVPLMVATEEKVVEPDGSSIDTTDSCQKEQEHISSPTEHNGYQKSPATDDGRVGETPSFYLEKFRKRLDSILEAEPHCCKCGAVSETDREGPKRMKPPFSLKLTEADYISAAALQDDHYSKLEIVKSLASAFDQKDMFVAVRVHGPTKFEKAVDFTVPVLVQHYLNPFTLPPRKTHRVVINPIEISTDARDVPDSELERDKKSDFISKPSPAEGCRNEAQTLGILDVASGKSVIVSNIPHVTDAHDQQPRVCLCDSCYKMVQNAIEKKKDSGHSPPILDDKLNGKVEAKKSTTPRLRPKNFDYCGRDAWVPIRECSKDEFVSQRVEATDILHIQDSDSDTDDSVESSEDMNLNSACEIVNDHLLNLRQVDQGSVQRAAQTLHRAWFEIVASEDADLEALRFYIRYFEEFSNNLIRTLLHSTDSRGNNVLHFTFANNRFDLVEELLNNGYAVELLKKTNQAGNSPLMVCSISLPATDSDWSAVRRSFEMGDVNGKSSKSGQTPLMNAASCGHEAMVNLLLEVGADPNLRDVDGSTALMYAAEQGQERCARAIMRHDTCDPTIRDEDGQTACSIALSNGHSNIAALIHMQAMEKRQLAKHSHSVKRHVWTRNGSSETEPVAVNKPHSISTERV